MGQKVSPIAIRTGINRASSSQWYAPFRGGQYAAWLQQDIAIRRFLQRQLRYCGVTTIIIRRVNNTKTPLEVIIRTAQPGLVIGQKGRRIEELILGVKKLLRQRQLHLNLEVEAIKHPHREAPIIAQTIARDLENRMPFRRAQKSAIQKALDAGVVGVRTIITGRLGGVDIARSEGYLRGKMPLATIRHDIDYALQEAITTYGVIGVKVWVARGEILTTRSPGGWSAEQPTAKFTR